MDDKDVEAFLGDVCDCILMFFYLHKTKQEHLHHVNIEKVGRRVAASQFEEELFHAKTCVLGI